MTLTETELTESMDKVAIAIEGHRYRFGSEKDLQLAISAALTQSGIPHVREVWLDKSDVVDFFILLTEDSGIGIEVKVEGSLSAATRQVHRYLGHPGILGMIVVSTRSKLNGIPSEMRDKPIRTIVLRGGLV